jgi:mannose-6-phosphate isomerase-like protein (cupin superfamily)
MTDGDAHPNTTDPAIGFPALVTIDVAAMIDACEADWCDQTLCRVNDSIISLGVRHGEYHWHKHDADDEFFFVLDGLLILDLEGRSIELRPQEGFVVPKGVAHRPRAPDRAVVLMVWSVDHRS